MNNQKGFTLIELLLYIGVSAIVLIALTVFYSVLLNARIRRETVAEVDEQGMAVMTLITQEIRNAEEIVLPVAGTSGEALTLNVSHPLLSPLVFEAADGVLNITEGGNSRLGTTNSKVEVSNLLIENLSRPGTPGSLQITYTLTRRSDSVRHEYVYARTFSGSASLRQP